MPTSITIRHVPEPVRDELARRAAAAGQSLQAYVLELLTRKTEQPTNADIMERVRRRVEAAGEGLTTEEILEARDADRR